jgi:hypothetical protein
MTVFSDIADQWRIADAAFSQVIQHAFVADDDVLFDETWGQRQKNDQAYFLYLFTRFESAVNRAIDLILDNRITGAPWGDRRIWEAWSRIGIEDVHFMSKVEVLTDKSRADYGKIRRYYQGRNDVAHGGTWAEQFFIPTIAQEMDQLCAGFPTA